MSGVCWLMSCSGGGGGGGGGDGKNDNGERQIRYNNEDLVDKK